MDLTTARTELRARGFDYPRTTALTGRIRERKVPRRCANTPGPTPGESLMQPDRTIPDGYCHCGCGERTPLARATQSDRGQFKGKPRPFVPGHGAFRRVEGEGIDYIVSPRGCWEWLGFIRPDGYGRVSPNRREMLAHRWYFEHFEGYCPPTLDHTCRNRRCVNPAHLEPVSRQSNVRRGLRAKLNMENARFIRRTELSVAELAELFDVSKHTIWSVRAERVWAEGKE